MRLFIGFTPPSEVLEKVEGWTLPLRKAGFPFRWLKSSSIHLTLHFLGEVDSPLQNELIRSLESELKGCASFPVAIDELGCFHRNGSVSILWAGIRPAAGLVELHQLLGRSIQKIGLLTEERPFTPHITLARPRSDARRILLSELSPCLGHRPQLECRLNHLTLFSSELGPQGARYCKQKEYQLA